MNEEYKFLAAKALLISRAELSRIKALKKRAERNALTPAAWDGSKRPNNAPGREIKPKKGIDTRKRAKAKLDAVFSIFVRLRGKKRTGGVCELCGKRPIECCFHWVGRGAFATRWDPDNAVASCRGCNFEETFRKQKYRDIHIARVGLAERERLESKARIITHLSAVDLKDKIACIEQTIKHD